MALGWLVLGFIILNGLTVYLDAKNINAGQAFTKEKFLEPNTWKAGSWSALTIFFWPVGLILYLFDRRNVFEANLLPIG